MLFELIELTIFNTIFILFSHSMFTLCLCFEVGSYKEHIYSWSLPYRNCQSAQPQFGELESRSRCSALNSSEQSTVTEQILTT